MTIPKGSKIGFIGKTGSGKSTLLDVIMGLINPSSGCLKIDGTKVCENNFRGWQFHLAHIPQEIFLSDGTIKENIAFGVPTDQIELERVISAAEKAQIAETIEGLELKYETKVGERGLRLSGGQRQRIGIARALYKKASVLIFDEATSALDSKTENSVMKSIEALGSDLTILVVAHRTSTLKFCDKIVEIKDAELSFVMGH